MPRGSLSRFTTFPVVSGGLVLLLYGSGLGNAFVYDDLPQVVENTAIHSVSAALGYFGHAVAFSADYAVSSGTFYRPMFWLSLSLDYAMWGPSPAGFHATNLLLHWVCGVLLWHLMRGLDVPAWFAISIPLAWLTLPVHTEVVAWVSGRPFSLATASMLAGLVCLAHYADRPHPLRLPLAALASVSALLSHEIGVLTPALALIVMVAGARRVRVDAKLATTLVGPLLLYLLMRAHAGSTVSVPDTSDVLDAALRIPLAAGRYAHWIVFPPLLSVERSTDWINLTAPAPIHALAWALLVALVAGTVVSWRRWPVGSFGLAWFAISLLPFLNLMPLAQGMAERYAYTPAIGLIVALGAALHAVARRSVVRRATCTIAVVTLVGWYAWRTTARVADWRDEWTLYATSLDASPESHVLRFNLAVKQAEAGRTDEAERLYREAVSLRPAYHAAKVNLANLLQRRGELAEARSLYEEVLAAEPARKEALLNLANLYQRLGEVDRAETAYLAALELDPRYLEAKLNLGALWQTTGRTSRARGAYSEILALDPDHPEAHLNLAVLDFQDDDLDAAITHLTNALRVRPEYPEAHFNLGVAYEAAGDRDGARRHYAWALELRPDYEKARMGLAQLDAH